MLRCVVVVVVCIAVLCVECCCGFVCVMQCSVCGVCCMVCVVFVGVFGFTDVSWVVICLFDVCVVGEWCLQCVCCWC